MSLRLMIKSVAVVMFALMLVAPAGAEPMTKEQGDAILKELKQIRKELQEIKKGTLRGPRRGPARPTTAKVETKDSPSLGDPEAPITLVEFTDYQCPFCRRFYTNTLSKIKAQYIDTGKVRLVLRDLPLAFHSKARPAAKATHCAGEQGKYWEMHDALFEGGGDRRRCSPWRVRAARWRRNACPVRRPRSPRWCSTIRTRTRGGVAAAAAVSSARWRIDSASRHG